MYILPRPVRQIVFSLRTSAVQTYTQTRNLYPKFVQPKKATSSEEIARKRLITKISRNVVYRLDRQVQIPAFSRAGRKREYRSSRDLKADA